MQFARMAAVVMALCGFCVPGAAADVTAKDLQVLSRALGFVQLPATASKIAIVYNPADTASVRSAEAARRLMGDSFKAGLRTLTVVLVSLSELDTLQDVAVLFAAADLGPDVAKVAAASQASKAPCVTDDLELVKRATCAIGVRTSPKVQIMVNKALTAAAGLTLDPAFKMLITEV
ncbi:MAG: hypothetical protein JO021_02095 [Alphaproteobacteria bacterium]|nr:hypothetical protein [Alphaproteobacteria bacterium]